MMTQHIKTNSLIESLRLFQAKVNGQTVLEELTAEFEKLAPVFLYGGYISVRNDYHIYIRTVEFYFHSETDSANSVKDPIVYHRNNRYVDGIVPYFPLMSLHAHASGFDITFENEKEEYRASALIRAYEVWDVKQKQYVCYDKNTKKFRLHKDNKNEWNGQSTYLYDFLNGFDIDGIMWKDAKTNQSIELKVSKRQGVYMSNDQNNYSPIIIDGHKIPDNRHWSFTRQEKLYKTIQDRDTNIVFLSEWLKTEDSDFFSRFTKLMEEMEIHWELLDSTNDIWARDYMPIQLGKNDFLKYKYWPNYLLEKKEDKKYITDCKRACKALGITYRETDMIIDGGNMVPCGDYIVMTDKVFTENQVEKHDPSFMAKLETTLGRHVIIIPWHQIGKGKYCDKYGHSDGFIKWCGDDRVLMSNHRNTDPEEADEIKQILENHGFRVTEMLFDVAKPSKRWNWAYVNFLQVGKKVIMPAFGIPEDEQAFNYIKEALPNCEIRQIQMRNIADNGGALHCITWNVML